MEEQDTIDVILEEFYKNNNIQQENEKPLALQSLKKYVKNLRIEYKKPICNVEYGDKNIQNAYMLAYFPHYTQQTDTLLEKLPRYVTDSLFGGEKIWISAFGCGPAPELVGIASFINKHYYNIKEMDAFLMDAYIKDWENYTTFSKDKLSHTVWNAGKTRTRALNCDLRKKCTECDEKSHTVCSQFVNQSKLFVLQNCLTDVGQDEKFILNKIETTFSLAKKGSVMLVLDFPYPKNKDIFHHLTKDIENKKIGKVISPLNYHHERTHPYPKIVIDNLLTGEDKLIPRRWTNFYSTAFIHC